MNPDSQPLVSIVTPMYNEAEFLSECIERVLEQTYQNWEYVIVDNCSTDGSADIAARFAKQDSRIRVLESHQFLRAVPNHNRALRQISPASKYCKVVFADDWLFPECVERMVALAEAHPTVGIVGAYGLDGTNVLWVGLPYPSTVISGRDACRRYFLRGPYGFGTASSVLYRADLVRSRTQFYPEDDINADTHACVELLKECDFGFVHQILSFTRMRDHSLVKMSQAMNTFAASELRQLTSHGRFFLSDEEFDRCLTTILDNYYIFLAGRLFRRCGNDFWRYHKTALQDAGPGFSRVRLARGLWTKLCSCFAHPVHTVRNSLRHRAVESDTFVRELAEP